MGSRSSSGLGRPEAQAPPEVYYDALESRKYSTNSRVQSVQAAMGARCLELLALDAAGGPRLVLDVGCGSGLSGDVLARAGHAWVGLDISQSMLEAARRRGSLGSGGSGRCQGGGGGDDDDEADEGEGDDDDDEDGGDGGRGSGGDALRCDMGQGFGFRAGCFDGAVSVSALQWLCYSDRKDHKAGRRLDAFFTSLYRCLRRGARAALQLYPEGAAQLELITASALRCGFTGGLVVDFPNSTKAKKFYLCLFAGVDSSVAAAAAPRALGAMEDADEDADEDGDEGEEGAAGDRLASAAASVRFGGRKARQQGFASSSAGSASASAPFSASASAPFSASSASSSAPSSGFVFGAGAGAGTASSSGSASHVAYEARRAQHVRPGKSRRDPRTKLKGTRKWVLEKKQVQRSRDDAGGGGGGKAVRRDTKYTGRKRGPRF